jgi:hypothetical protein
MKMIQSLTDAELHAQLRKAAEEWDALIEEKRRRQREHFSEASEVISQIKSEEVAGRIRGRIE